MRKRKSDDYKTVLVDTIVVKAGAHNAKFDIYYQNEGRESFYATMVGKVGPIAQSATMQGIRQALHSKVVHIMHPKKTERVIIFRCHPGVCVADVEVVGKNTDNRRVFIDVAGCGGGWTSERNPWKYRSKKDRKAYGVNTAYELPYTEERWTKAKALWALYKGTENSAKLKETLFAAVKMVRPDGHLTIDPEKFDLLNVDVAISNVAAAYKAEMLRIYEETVAPAVVVAVP